MDKYEVLPKKLYISRWLWEFLTDTAKKRGLSFNGLLISILLDWYKKELPDIR